MRRSRLDRSFAASLIALAAGTGLRLGELLALSWGAEGDAGRRDVPIPAEDVARLRKHRMATGRRDGDLAFAGRRGEALSPVPSLRGFRRASFRAGVFTGGTDEKLQAEPSYDAFRRACRKRGINEPLPRFHDRRHAFATHALAAGLSAHAVARLLGHSDPGLVWKRYAHALPTELAGAGEALSAFRRRALAP